MTIANSQSSLDFETIAQEVSGLGQKVSDLEERLEHVEKVNTGLEEAALTTARALQEISSALGQGLRGHPPQRNDGVTPTCGVALGRRSGAAAGSRSDGRRLGVSPTSPRLRWLLRAGYSAQLEGFVLKFTFETPSQSR